jgi:hypothetical protein
MTSYGFVDISTSNKLLICDPIQTFDQWNDIYKITDDSKLIYLTYPNNTAGKGVLITIEKNKQGALIMAYKNTKGNITEINIKFM